MDVKDKVVVVTGAASGIGRGLAQRFATEGARAVVAVDFDGPGATAAADEIRAGGAIGESVAMTADVSVEADVAAVIERCESELGPIDLFCSNAGILVIGGQELPDDEWRRIIDVNLMGHIYAARHLVPRMVDRGGGYLLNTCSAAGLLTQIGSAPYSVTKHAAPRLRGVAGGDLRRPRAQGLGAVPAGGGVEDDDGDRGRRRGRRRRHAHP